MVSKKYKSIVSIFQKHIQDNEISVGTMFFIDLANYFRKTIDKEKASINELLQLLQNDTYYTHILRKCILANFKNLEFRKILSDTGILDNTHLDFEGQLDFVIRHLELLKSVGTE